MEENDGQKITTEESFNVVRDGKGVLLAVIGRDLVSNEHLIYIIHRSKSKEIADFIKTKPIDL